MFDRYLPLPALACPACGAELTDWQGKDGPCALLLWRQGAAEPVLQDVDPEVAGDWNELRKLRLPREFEIYTSCCDARFLVFARGLAPDGIWTATELETAGSARQRSNERREEFAARLQWLCGARPSAQE